MIIAICVLGILLFCALFIILSLWYAISKLMNEYIDSNPKVFMKYYFDNQAIEHYNCTLLLTINNDADFDGSVYNFSQYEEKNIIELIECKKETTKHNNEEPRIALLPNQTVYKMKDGSFQWDFRGLM